MYNPVTMLDDSAIWFVVELEDGVDHTITEYQQPAAMELTLRSNSTPVQPHRICALRTVAMPMGETLGMLEELYPDEDSSFIKISDHTFVAVIGEYTTEAQAERKLKQLTSDSPDDQDFYVDSWMSNAKPVDTK